MLNLSNKLGLNNSKNHPSGASGFANLYSLSFDGVDDYVDLGDADVFTPNNSGAGRGFSISFWTKIANSSERIINKSYIFSLGSYHYEYDIKTDFAGRMKLTLYSADSSSNTIIFRIDTALSINTWHHLSFSWNLGVTSADLVAHLDGVKYSSANANATWSTAGTFTTVSNTVNPLVFAKQLPSSYGEIHLDEVALFDDAITDSTALSIYNSGSPADLSSIPYLTGWWRNGDTAGTSVYPTITDDSSNSNDGTMTNMDSGDIVTDVP